MNIELFLEEGIAASRMLRKKLTYDKQLEFKKFAMENYDFPEFYFDYITGVDATTEHDIPGLIADGSLTYENAIDVLLNYFKINDSCDMLENEILKCEAEVLHKHTVKSDIAVESNHKNDIMNESEDIIDNDLGILRCSARDMIFKDSEILGNDVDVQELWLSQFGLKSKLPIIPDENEIKSISEIQKTSLGGYRTLAYIYNGKSDVDSKWYNASNSIENEYDFDEYVDPQSSNNSRYPEEYDVEFAKTFKTYESWMKYKNDLSIKAFKDILENSGKLQYKYAAENIKIDENGSIYTIITWRA